MLVNGGGAASPALFSSGKTSFICICVEADVLRRVARGKTSLSCVRVLVRQERKRKKYRVLAAITATSVKKDSTQIWRVKQ